MKREDVKFWFGDNAYGQVLDWEAIYDGLEKRPNLMTFSMLQPPRIQVVMSNQKMCVSVAGCELGVIDRD